ncbi:MAG: class I poly(R)-hydroxyalkanoic acid synthase [Propionivibrio sp.]
MTTEKSPSSTSPFETFLHSSQSLTRSYLDFVTGQQSAFLPPSEKPGMPLPIPDASTFVDLQQALVAKHTQLWQNMLQQKPGQSAEPVVVPEAGDRRFAADAWSELPYYDYLRQAYLLNADYLNKVADAIPIVDGPGKTRMLFLTRLFVQAMSPANFAATNPEFVKTALESKGQSITDGIRNMLEDLNKGRISMTDEAAFEIGRNIATTPGTVVFENDLMQLIQYTPTTDKVFERPILLVPPFINKYYLMDLQPENSFVGYVVEQGFTTFLISWRSATPAQGHCTWEDYLEMGPIKALEVVREITGIDKPNVLGFCIGGPLLCSALAVLKARGEDPAESLTLMTALLDYSEPGEIGALVTEPTIAAYDATIGKGGVMQGRNLASVFSALRANDLIWQYVVNNYLKGQKPQPFDLLYWNSDSTNLPGPCFTWYVRNMYLNNSLRVPGKLTMLGEKVDLSKITMPAYLMAAREDHLVLWQPAYLSRNILGGPTTYVLAASGHIAGSINPASKNRRNYWINDSEESLTADEWVAGATEKKGSWWPHWTEWLGQRSGKQIAAPKKPGNKTYKEIEPAPGRYVKAKASA